MADGSPITMRDHIVSALRKLGSKVSAPTLRMKIFPMPQMPDLLRELDRLVAEGTVEKFDEEPRPAYLLNGKVRAEPLNPPETRRESSDPAPCLTGPLVPNQEGPRPINGVKQKRTVQQMILEALGDDGLTTAELLDEVPAKASTVQSELSAMKNAGTVWRETGRRGRWHKRGATPVSAAHEPPQPQAAAPEDDSATAELSRLKRRLEGGERITIEDLAEKQDTLTLLEELVAPSLARVLAKIRADLKRVAA